MTCVYVRVRAGGEHYALPVEKVLEVGALREVTPVPGAHPAVIGVSNLRGQIFPVADLATLFGLDRAAERNSIVVTDTGGRRAGVAVESVVDVGDLPAPTESADSEHLIGAALVDCVLVGIIDLDSALDALAGGVSR
jgi:purine-binding chemotaxis protein CheW